MSLSDPLISLSALTYLGAFKLPPTSGSGPGNPNSFHDGGQAMAYDPYTDTLIVQGNYRYGNASRVTIPTPSIPSPPTASFVGSWMDMLWRFPNSNVDAADNQIGGFLPLPNGDMIISYYVYYDANNTQNTTHVRRTAAGVVSSKVLVGQAGRAGFTSGWMFPIPSTWQSLFGGPSITGNGSLSIISRTSLGPAASIFNPANIPNLNPTPAGEVLSYPINHPTLGTCETGTIFNCAASNNRAGLIWIDNTATLLYLHHVCEVNPVYSGGWTCPTGRKTKWLFYNANDLLAVKNGSKQPWDVLPYAIVNAGAELLTNQVRSITYNAQATRIYVAEGGGDGPQPLIHVYSVNVVPVPGVPAPTPEPIPTTPPGPIAEPEPTPIPEPTPESPLPPPIPPPALPPSSPEITNPPEPNEPTPSQTSNRPGVRRGWTKRACNNCGE